MNFSQLEEIVKAAVRVAGHKRPALACAQNIYDAIIKSREEYDRCSHPGLETIHLSDAIGRIEFHVDENVNGAEFVDLEGKV